MQQDIMMRLRHFSIGSQRKAKKKKPHYWDDSIYLNLLPSAQLAGTGAYHTCYDWWTGAPVGFVEPQFDSAGAFLMGVYHHYVLTADIQFLNRIRNRISAIENFFLSHIGDYDFAPPDYSIWEESSDGRTGKPLPPAYFTFTQSMATTGLWSVLNKGAVRYPQFLPLFVH